MPVQYHLEYEDHEYYIRYRWGWISIDRDEDEVFERRLGGEFDGAWSDEQTTVYLGLISDAIRQGSFEKLELPNTAQVSAHPWFRTGLLPEVEAGIVCGKKVPPLILLGMYSKNHKNRVQKREGIHLHSDECVLYVPASELDAWICEHPEQHKELQTWHRGCLSERLLNLLISCVAIILVPGFAVKDWLERRRGKHSSR